MITASKKQKKVKFWVLIIVVVLSITLAMTLLYFMALKPTYNEAIVLYKDAFSDYNRVVSEYSTKVEQINQENEKLKSAINSLQEIVSFGEKPYDPDTITNANAAINKGKIATITIPKWEDKALKVPTDFNIFQTKSIKQAVEKTKDYSSSLTTIVGLMKIPDYSEVLSTIDEAKNVLEKSIKQMKQVTCPSESFVLERITNIRNQAGMTDVISLTEDNDPENYIGKAGWYTVKVVFRHKDVEHYGLESGSLTLNQVGNPAGGCIEVYRTEEDAERRANELKSQEGTVKSPGARVVCGTVVIRVSDSLKASYQQELLTLIVDELIRLEDGNQNLPPETPPEEPSFQEPPPPETTPPLPDETESPVEDVPPFVLIQPVDRSQEAVVEAEKRAQMYFPTNRQNIKECLTIPSVYNDFEVFSESEAEYAINNANINWGEHALQTAKNYVQNNPNSTFTPYDITSLFDWTLNFQEFELLYAVNNCGVNWYDAAVKYAEYLDYYIFDDNYNYEGHRIYKEQMINEITKHGFTNEQAIYGVNNCSIDWESRIDKTIIKGEG